MAGTSVGPEVDAFISGLRDQIVGAKAIVLADRDGVAFSLSCDPGFEFDAERLLLSSASVMAEQAGKVGRGRATVLIALWSNEILVHVPFMPLVLSILGTEAMNVGLITAMRSAILAALDPVRIAAED